MLEVNGLVCGYEGTQILNGVGLRVGTGEIVAVIGPNGAGKSTLLKAIAGLLRPKSGEVFLDGKQIYGMPAETIVRLGLGYVPQVDNVFPSLTVAENLDVMFPRGMSRLEVSDRLQALWLLLPALHEHLRSPARLLSGGERQMLALARAVVGRPVVLMLDEPSASLAPNVVDQIFRLIGDINNRGVAILLVEQNARRALAICHRAYVLEGGKNVLSGSGPDLLADPQVGRLYLGARSAESD